MKFKIKKMFKIIFIVLFIVLLINLFKQLYYIYNSDLIIESNYQNGIVISETSMYAISEKFCEEITMPIPIPLSKTNKGIRSYEYSIKYNADMSDDYEIRSYTDPELNQIDEKIVKKILLDAKKKSQ